MRLGTELQNVTKQYYGTQIDVSQNVYEFTEPICALKPSKLHEMLKVSNHAWRGSRGQKTCPSRPGEMYCQYHGIVMEWLGWKTATAVPQASGIVMASQVHPKFGVVASKVGS